MKTEIIRNIVYAKVKINSRYSTIKVLKNQVFTTKNNIKHHLICNLYYTILRNHLIDAVEIGPCKTKPMILSKFTFRHEPRKTHKPSLFKKPYYLLIKDY